MDERELLLLGLLMVQSQHGYQINEFIERNLDHIVAMKKPTAYALLERLSQAGYVAARSEQDGKRPPRTVYQITPTGSQMFLTLLRENLARAERMTFAGDVGVLFLDHLPREEVLALLGQRFEAIEAALVVHEQTPPHEHGLGVTLALEHVLLLERAERDWLASVIERLQTEDGLAPGRLEAGTAKTPTPAGEDAHATSGVGETPALQASDGAAIFDEQQGGSIGSTRAQALARALPKPQQQEGQG